MPGPVLHWSCSARRTLNWPYLIQRTGNWGVLSGSLESTAGGGFLTTSWFSFLIGKMVKRIIFINLTGLWDVVHLLWESISRIRPHSEHSGQTTSVGTVTIFVYLLCHLTVNLWCCLHLDILHILQSIFCLLTVTAAPGTVSMALASLLSPYELAEEWHRAQILSQERITQVI